MKKKNKPSIKILTYVLLLLPVLYSCSLSGNITVNNGLLKEAVNQQYQIYYGTKYIDNAIVRLLKKRKNIDFHLSNPEEPYNPTDIYVKGLPEKRLVSFGRSLNNISIVLYQERTNQGYMCLIYKRNVRNDYVISGIGLSEKVKSISDVIEAIKNNSFIISSLAN